MKIKTSELEDELLDQAVAKCLGLKVWKSRGGWMIFESDNCPEFRNDFDDSNWQRFCPTYDWSQGGLIIEREKIAIDWDNNCWNASTDSHPAYYSAETPLIAAMRCYVASKLGDEIELPEEV